MMSIAGPYPERLGWSGYVSAHHRVPFAYQSPFVAMAAPGNRPATTPATPAARTTAQRLVKTTISRAAATRRAAVRDLGLILADGVLQEVEVDLHDVLDQCMDGPAWGCDQ